MSARHQFALTLPVKQYFYCKPVKFTTNRVICPEVIFLWFSGVNGGQPVVFFNHLLPPELSVHVKDVLCENGEMRFVFGPSQYRLDRFIEDLGKDPFADE